MQIWQLQEAKAKLTQLIKEARHQPQVISRHGIPETVVISMQAYQNLIGKRENLVSFLRKSPLHGIDLKLKRDQSGMRETDL